MMRETTPKLVQVIHTSMCLLKGDNMIPGGQVGGNHHPRFGLGPRVERCEQGCSVPGGHTKGVVEAKTAHMPMSNLILHAWLFLARRATAICIFPAWHSQASPEGPQFLHILKCSIDPLGCHSLVDAKSPKSTHMWLNFTELHGGIGHCVEGEQLDCLVIDVDEQ